MNLYEIKKYNILLQEEVKIILNLLHENKYLETPILVSNLIKSSNISRATAYRRIKNLKELNIIKELDSTRRKNKIWYITHGIKRLIKNFLSNNLITSEIVCKVILKLNTKKKIKTRSKIVSDKEIVTNRDIYPSIIKSLSCTEEKQTIDKGSMATRVFQGTKSSNNILLSQHGMGQTNSTGTTKSAKNSVADRWKFLRKTNFSSKQTKKQKKILSIIY